jgi:DNA-binding response OmpR family regulator
MEKNQVRILVVDDDKYLLDIIKIILESEGYIVETAIGGPEAMASLNAQKANLVLLDIRLPGEDGYQVLRQIRLISNVPVIMLTGVAEAASVAQSVELGADGYIRKPISSQELIAIVRNKLKRTTSQNC